MCIDRRGGIRGVIGCVPVSGSFVVQNDENELLILSGLFSPF